LISGVVFLIKTIECKLKTAKLIELRKFRRETLSCRSWSCRKIFVSVRNLMRQLKNLIKLYIF